MITPAYAITATERVLPRMALDFTTGVLDPRVTVTRALNTATRINSSGLVELVNANLPRFDYDPTTLAPKGLLIEEARTNLVLYSQEFDNAAWLKLASGTASLPVVTANAGVAPDGTTTADRVVLNRGAGTTIGDLSRLFQNTGIVATLGTLSVYMRSFDGVSTYTVRLYNGSAETNVTVTPSWQRFTLVSTNTTTNAQIAVRGDVTQQTADILVWGAQMEAGAFATSYIPTTLLTVTRNADVVSMTGTNFSDWYNVGAGSWYMQTNARNAATILTAGTFTLAATATALKKYANSYASDQSATSLVLGSGTVAKVAYYKQALLAAELAALTN